MIDVFVRSLPLLAQGLTITVTLGVTSFLLGSVAGFGLALMRLFGPRAVRVIAVTYVSVFRGTPLLVQILVLYFGLPQLGIRLDPIPSAIIALSLNAAAYLSENFRAGIIAVDRGQWEAASSLGMPFWRVLQRVVVPQALRVAMAPVGSRFIALMKDTSLASVVTVVELTRIAEQIGAATFRYMELFIIVAFVYWLVNSLLATGQDWFERRLGRAY